MSKETKSKRTRSTKKISEESPHTAELEAKIAELEAKLANLSSQVKPAETRPAGQAAKPAEPKAQRGTLPAGMKPAESPKPAPAPAPKPRPAATGPTPGTLPAGMKPTPPPAPKEEPRPQTYAAPEAGEVAPAYAQVSSTGYTGNKYYATRARLSYHPPTKQFKGKAAETVSTYEAPPPPPPAPESKPQRGTLPAGMKPAEQQRTMSAESEKKSMWKAKGSEYENYVPEEETYKAPPPPPAPEPRPQRGTLPAGFKSTPPPAPKPAPAPEPARQRPAATGPTHGTLPAGMKPTPPPAPKEEARAAEAGEVAPAYAQVSSTGYTGNKYYATRRRLSYHPPNKQFTGSTAAGTTEAPPAPAPAPKKAPRGTLPAGFKP